MHPEALADCATCADQPGRPHADWHPTHDELLAVGREMSRRAVSREQWAISTMPDALLEAHVTDLKRQAAMTGADHLPDFLAELVAESLETAEREWRWRKRAASLGAPGLARDSRWRDRIETVRREADLGMLIAYDCANAKPAGLGKWVATCPFHADRTPSLSIDVAKGLWLCRGCGVGGDAFTYVQLREGLDFTAALAHLEDRLGIRPPLPPRKLVE